MTESKNRLHPHDAYRGVRDASTLSQEAKDFLAEVLPPERDDKGKFKRGRLLGGPGRKPNSHGVYNFRAIVAEYLARLGNNPDMIVAELFEDMMAMASNGDAAAAKFLIERICGKDAEQIDMAVTTAKLSEVDRMARLAAIFAEAAKRKRGEANVN